MSAGWQSLSDDELLARLVHRGYDEDVAGHLVDDRDMARAEDAISVALGDEP